MRKIQLLELVNLLNSKFNPEKKESLYFKQAKNFIDPQIIPKIYAFSGKGIKLQTNISDYNGKVLDFSGQTLTCILGQNDPWVTANMISFMLSNRPSFLSTSIGQEIYYTVSKRIIQATKMGSDVFINHRLNNGSNATDFAVDIAYRHAKNKKKTLLAFKGSYHGQGHLPYGMSDLQTEFRFFGDVKVIFLEAPDHTENIDKNSQLSKHDKKIINAIHNLSKDAFAVIIEPIQFNNNGNTPSQTFIQALRSECTRRDIPLIFDEIQTGWGWLGTMTASERYGVWPDIMAISKSLTAGYGPLSVVVAKNKFKNSGAFGARTNGSDVRSLVAANAVMDRLLGTKEIPPELENTPIGNELKIGLLTKFNKKHLLLKKHLNDLQSEINHMAKEVRIGKIKGDGLARMIEIKNRKGEFNSNFTKKLQNELLIKGGVFVRIPSNHKNVNTLYIKMPIVTSAEEMNEGFKRMKKIMINFTFK